MAFGYRVANLRLTSGERLPLLLDSTTGVPLWSPTLFILTELRAKNRASATMLQATRAIMVAVQALKSMKVDLEKRLSEGRLLDLNEIDELAGLAGLTQEALDARLAAVALDAPATRPRVLSLEKVRMGTKASDEAPQVGVETKAIRLTYIRDYVSWLARRKILTLDC